MTEYVPPYKDEVFARTLMDIAQTPRMFWPIAYTTIHDYYGNRTAERSGVPLISHIIEGLAILRQREAEGVVMITYDAWCLHPIVQDGKENEVPMVHLMPAYELACEYRDKANAYLCRPENDNVDVTEVARRMGPMSRSCALMLLADKLQNRHDFYQYHLGTHPRSAELQRYFDTWLEYLKHYHNLT